MKQVRRDFHAADLSDQERTMLEFVGSLTLDSKSLRERDVQRLREVGFDDLQILEIVQLAGWFNCITRIADALGVEVESWRAEWKDNLLAEDASQVLVEQPSAKGKA
ncbi:MAG: peroxidase [Deltaproteobacteria bacterium]|nr:peroxidase [Deltaproteobacteria bacterium]